MFVKKIVLHVTLRVEKHKIIVNQEQDKSWGLETKMGFTYYCRCLFGTVPSNALIYLLAFLPRSPDHNTHRSVATEKYFLTLQTVPLTSF